MCWRQSNSFKISNSCFSIRNLVSINHDCPTSWAPKWMELHIPWTHVRWMHYLENIVSICSLVIHSSGGYPANTLNTDTKQQWHFYNHCSNVYIVFLGSKIIISWLGTVIPSTNCHCSSNTHTRMVNHNTQYLSWGQSMLMSPASSNTIKHDLTGYSLPIHWFPPRCILQCDWYHQHDYNAHTCLDVLWRWGARIALRLIFFVCATSGPTLCLGQHVSE